MSGKRNKGRFANRAAQKPSPSAANLPAPTKQQTEQNSTPQPVTLPSVEPVTESPDPQTYFVDIPTGGGSPPPSNDGHKNSIYTYIYWAVFVSGCAFAFSVVHNKVLPSIVKRDPNGAFLFHWLFTIFLAATFYHVGRIYGDLHSMNGSSSDWLEKYSGFFNSPAEKVLRSIQIVILICAVGGEFPLVETMHAIHPQVTVKECRAQLTQALNSPLGFKSDPVTEAKINEILINFRDDIAGDDIRVLQFAVGSFALFLLMIVWDVWAGFITKQWEGFFILSDSLAFAFWLFYLLNKRHSWFGQFVTCTTVTYCGVMIVRFFKQKKHKLLVLLLTVFYFLVTLILEPQLINPN